MSNQIKTPYKINSKEKKLIQDRFDVHEDWSKECFKTLKDSIIEHLRKEQNNKCCYCKRELGFDLKEVEIEHIIPKAEYVGFTFHMKNLALSCPGCNTSKNAGQVLYKPVKNYPRNGNNFKIIHAHYDDYERHITIHFESIYEGTDDKGVNTIGACKLYRLKSVMQKQRESDIKNGSLTFKLVQALMQATPEQRQDLEHALINIMPTK